jgi:hypothetical protein
VTPEQNPLADRIARLRDEAKAAYVELFRGAYEDERATTGALTAAILMQGVTERLKAIENLVRHSAPPCESRRRFARRPPIRRLG